MNANNQNGFVVCRPCARCASIARRTWCSCAVTERARCAATRSLAVRSAGARWKSASFCSEYGKYHALRPYDCATAETTLSLETDGDYLLLNRTYTHKHRMRTYYIKTHKHTHTPTNIHFMAGRICSRGIVSLLRCKTKTSKNA